MKRAYKLGVEGPPVKGWRPEGSGPRVTPGAVTAGAGRRHGPRPLARQGIGGSMRENARTTILLGALAVALAACADQPPPAGPTHDFEVSYYQLPGPGNPPAVAAAVGVLNPDNV